ncbi:hypothetical protein LZ838_06135 [Pseudomonas sp. AA27]|uniref:hypothetical protein n=1 Tax=Pseudomonas sp. AA27 TaxID=2908652 RepID=UPI001F2532FC|nr:hypothetical protein [Pseudomonas sp. AA27]MCF1486933.1 hypothetical protein [Pseudomonas sp. AA27]
MDYWVAARLRHLLAPQQWSVLNAKYATSKASKLKGISAIAPLVASPAPQLFIFKAVTAWAIPKLKGVHRKKARSVVVDVPLDAPAWRRERMMNAASAADHAERKKVDALTQGLIILPDSFYDMNTWYLGGVPEPTRYRWRAGIKEKFDGLVSDPLMAVQEILEEEELLSERAA